MQLSFQKNRVNYHGCTICGLTFIFPCPDEETLNKKYEDYGRRYYSIYGLRSFLLSAKHYHREVALLLRTAKMGTLLDVGCSVGGFVKTASELGYLAEGIDISPASVSIGQSAGLKIRAGNFLTSIFTAKFDVITMWATLEHLPNPNRYIERTCELLRPGGVLLASVPNFGGITHRLIGTRDRYVGIDHLNYWTARGFASYIAGFGLNIIETVTCGFNPVTLLKDWRNCQHPVDCEQMALEQTKSASLKATWIAHAHGFVEKVLNLRLLGDQVSVAARLPG